MFATRHRAVQILANVLFMLVLAGVPVSLFAATTIRSHQDRKLSVSPSTASTTRSWRW